MTRQQRYPGAIFAMAVLVLAVATALGASRPAWAQAGGRTPDLTTTICDFVDTGGEGEGFHDFIEDACTDGLISGCGGDRFCPGEFIMREDMALSLEKLYRGASFTPAAATVDPFTDVSRIYPFAPWIKQLGPACDGITAGCGNNAYCPYAFVSRWEMAVFLSKVISPRRGEEVPAYGEVDGEDYNCTSTTYPDNPPSVSLFADVPWNDGGCKYIHYIFDLGITVGCGPGVYCPTAYVPREQMATFLSKALDELTQPAPADPCQ